MTTPHRPQPQASSATSTPATPSRWMTSGGSSPSRSGSPSDGTSAGTAANTAITWLDALLQSAQLGADASEAFTPAKNIFQSFVVLLEDMKKMKNNQEALKGLCEKILSALQTLQHVIQACPSDASTVQLRGKCQQLLDGISGKIEEIKKTTSSGHLKFKQFVLPSAIASYEKNITDLQEELKLLTASNMLAQPRRARESG
ncbi:hypothetical protein C8F01DRAFT_1250373 [Mycena amicta]|nr:hypothetical protein C8F01DRAFT_1250373 [Mycena amicta]